MSRHFSLKVLLWSIFFVLWTLPTFASEPLFLTYNSYGVGGSPIAFCSGDLDGDGDLDLAVLDYYRIISILMNNGDGTFQDTVNYEIEAEASCAVDISCTDLDGDGDLDLAVTVRHFTNAIFILKNNGDGTFQVPVSYAIPGAYVFPASLFCADLDGDNDIDIAVSCWEGMTSVVWILKNNGDGAFQASNNYPVSDQIEPDPRSLFCADLDGDGDIDIAVACNFGGTVCILKNNGNGTFQGAGNYEIAGSPKQVFCADLDGDSDLDLAVSSFVPEYNGNSIFILKNNGNGTFQGAGNYRPFENPSGESSGLFCADLDGDSDLDLAATSRGPNCVSVLMNNGDGTFVDIESAEVYGAYGSGSSPISVLCLELDVDGDIDLAVLGKYVSILKNNGDGTFHKTDRYKAGTEPASVFCADLDGDGDLDIAVANHYDSFSIFKNNGDGTFQNSVNYYGIGPHPTSIFCADIDGDSDLDLAVSAGSAVFIFKNNGDGTFVSAGSYNTAGTTPSSVFGADLDGDGDIDLATADYCGGHVGNDNVSILKNNGDGTFQAAVSYGVGDGPYFICGADLDGDGDLDLAVANNYSSDTYYVSILKNNGDGTFQAVVNYRTGDKPFSISCADLDGDSDIDLAVAVVYGDVSILMNNGDGTFASAVDYLTPGALFSIFSADLDGDGDLDLAAANFWDHNVCILRNNGDGTFTNSREVYEAGIQPIFVFCADLDMDGDIDLAVANELSDDISISKNLTNVPANQRGDINGDGTINIGDVVYLIAYLYKGGPSPEPLIVGDVNCNGIVDVGDVVYLVNYLYEGGPSPCE